MRLIRKLRWALVGGGTPTIQPRFLFLGGVALRLDGEPLQLN